MLKNNNIIKNLSYGITAFLFIFSYSLCFAVSLQLNIWYALVTAITASLISVTLKSEVLAPDTFFTVPLLLVLSSGNNSLLPFSIIGGALIYFALNKKFKESTIHPAVFSGLSLSLAFSVTALLTTHYFGIGAEGFTVIEILKTYRSLGFHPNWRGVFFGTITLFCMITYPFKFKKANKYLPAECFSLLLPLLLNLILNPQENYTPINELKLNFGFITKSELSFFLPSFSTEFDFAMQSYINAFISAFSIGALLLLFNSKTTRTDSTGITSILNGVQGGFPVRNYKIRGYSLTSAIVSVLLIVYACFFLDDILMRIPLHSAAVVLIVNAWKQVPFVDLAKGFKNGVFSTATIFILFITSIVTNIFITITLAVIFNILLSSFNKSKGGANNG
ncbi:MAG: hypothetical protein IKT89_00010 [Clostridia bacterium]|nr:hypothetical protein [Clostridia bacterium]